MRNRWYGAKPGGLALAALALSISTAPPSRAANCPVIRQEIKQERNLLQRRTMLEQAIKNCPADPEINTMYAYNLERLRKYEEALKYYVTATTLDPNAADAYNGMGDIHMLLGDPGLAIQAYQKGLALEPANTRAERALATARIKDKAQSGREITSAEFVQVMEERNPKNAEASSLVGPILRMQIAFESNSADLTATAKKQLAKVIVPALQHQTLRNAVFEVAGHTDNSGDSKSNLALSRSRAEAVRTYLVRQHGIAPGRLQVAAFGQERPAVPNTSEQNRTINRRVEFRRLD